jgi:hypothetical protein
MPGSMQFIGGGKPTIKQILALAVPEITWDAIYDAGAAESYPGTGQKFLDMSGNGINFDLGTTDGVDAATDPEFIGTPDSRDVNTYFELDGTEYFRWNDGGPYAMNYHRINQEMCVLGWYWAPDPGSHFLLSTGALTARSMWARCDSNGRIIVEYRRLNNAFTVGDTLQLVPSIFATINTDGWNFAAYTAKDVAETITYRQRINGDYLEDSDVFVNPGFDGAGNGQPYLGAQSNITEDTADTRVMGMASAGVFLTEAQLDAIAERTKAMRLPGIF